MCTMSFVSITCRQSHRRVYHRRVYHRRVYHRRVYHRRVYHHRVRSQISLHLHPPSVQHLIHQPLAITISCSIDESDNSKF